MRRIIAVDPGGTTGIAVQAPEQSLHTMQLPQQEACDRLVDLIAADDIVVFERFTITAQTLRKSRSTAALEVIGVLRWAATKHGATLVEQTPGDAKKFSTDDRLRRLGMWQGSSDHANDACRHLLLYAVRAGLINPEDLHAEG